jgi:NADPH:quinone reductase-like Zn-dependent oxidoreductase
MLMHTPHATGGGRTGDAMKAIVQDTYGGPDVLRLEDVEVPTASAGEVLLRVRAAAVNPADWHFVRGEPYVMRAMGFGLRRPRNRIPGFDVAGIVEAVGPAVTRFAPGDAVVGHLWSGGGAFAEYARAGEGNIVAKPAGLSWERAAALPIAGLTALAAMRDVGRVTPGQSVLINGASGGVGTFAVQIARTLGARVTGVCSTRNADLVTSLGADRVIDYTREDFTAGDERYDVVLDNVANHRLSAVRGVVAPGGTLMSNNGDSKDRWFGAAARAAGMQLTAPFVAERIRPVRSRMRREDLAALVDLVDSGMVTPVIGQTFSLGDTPAAIAHVEAGHARGKTVIVT